jgi:Ca-activated chloride channel family protein
VRVRSLLVVLCFAGTVAAVAGRQAPTERPPAGKRFSSGIDVVMITATVVDAAGGLVGGLTKGDFEVFEDGEPQVVTYFAGDRVAVSLGLLLDVSDSMYGQRIKDARAAVGTFLFDLLSPDDEFFVLAFNHQPKVIVPWSHTPDQVSARLDALHPSGGTAIYDAMMAGLPLLEARNRQRAAVVLISDGADTASDVTVRQVRSALLRSDAFVYAIAIDPPDTRPINVKVNPYTLRDLTDDTGGRTEVVHDTADLGAATRRIAEDLNQQYVLGYSSSKKPDGQYHSIRVRVTREGLRVRARRGYVAAPIAGR